MQSRLLETLCWNNTEGGEGGSGKEKLEKRILLTVSGPKISGSLFPLA